MNARRGWVRAQERGRVAVARELAGIGQAGTAQNYPEMYASPARRLPEGASFDVHAAREHGERLVALGAEYRRFVAWTRAQGKGPENREPGAFIDDCETCGGLGFWETEANEGGPCPDCIGGWPGKLAREWPWDSRAPTWGQSARLGQLILDALEGQPDACQRCAGDGLGALARVWAAAKSLSPDDALVVMAVAADIHGVPVPVSVEVSWPDERLTFIGEPDASYIHRPRELTISGLDVSGQCPDCNGSGHNLRGSLHPIEWSPQVRRKVADAIDAVQHYDDKLAPWILTAGELINDSPSGPAGPWQWETESPRKGRPWTSDTRVCPRGEHRWEPAADVDHEGDTPLADQVRGFRVMRDCANHGEQHDAHVRSWIQWRTWSKAQRGELLHAEQRRARAVVGTGWLDITTEIEPVSGGSDEALAEHYSSAQRSISVGYVSATGGEPW